MTRHDPVVLVMGKAPRPGNVKTRLQPLLGPEGCALLQAELIRHTTELTSAHGLRTHLAFDPSDAREELARLVPAGVHLFPQCEGDLGQRLTAAVDEVFADRPGPLLVIGADAPTLTSQLLATAVTALRQEVDIVLGPALDGGYYLIGLHQPTPALFDLDPVLWGGPEVLAATLARAAELDLSAALLPLLRDLDTPADAAALLADPLLPARIAAVLRPVEVG